MSDQRSAILCEYAHQSAVLLELHSDQTQNTDSSKNFQTIQLDIEAMNFHIHAELS